MTTRAERPGDLEPFLVLPFIETPAELRRSPGVVAVTIASVAAVAVGGAWPWVTRSLEATTDGLASWELWRLVTNVFPHEHGWLHVAVNMVVLTLFGWQLERSIGTARFLVVYFGSGAVGMALLFAFNPIDADRGIRSGASLAVFGVVAGLTACHAVCAGWRSQAMLWALPTCAVLLTAAGVRQIKGKEGLIDPGIDGFQFGFWSHALGMAAGVVLALLVAEHSSRTARVVAGAVAVFVLVGGVQIGATRWA